MGQLELGSVVVRHWTCNLMAVSSISGRHAVE